MISHPFTYKKGDLRIELNWDKSVVPCKKVRIKLGDKQITLKRDEFATLMAVFADEKQMEDILQIEKTDFVSVERMLKLRLKKDMKAGEDLVFPYTHWIPMSDYEQLKEDGEMVKMVKDSEKRLIDFVADNEAARNVKKMWKDGKLELSTT